MTGLTMYRARDTFEKVGSSGLEGKFQWLLIQIKKKVLSKWSSNASVIALNEQKESLT